MTPVLNGARYLPELLRSVREQDYPALEHVVVDGGSTDGTLDLLRAEPGLLWTSARDRGMYDAVGKGLRRATGAIVAYQNADDRYAAPDAVSRAVAALAAHPDADVVYGDYRLIDADGRPLREVRGRDFDAAALTRYNFVPPHSTFVRRRVLDDEGLWPDPSLQYCGDWEWFLRMSAAGRVFLHLPSVLSEFRAPPRAQDRVHEPSRQGSRMGAGVPPPPPQPGPTGAVRGRPGAAAAAARARSLLSGLGRMADGESVAIAVSVVGQH